MTTTLTAPEEATATDGSRRMLAIAANLLPAEIADGRRTRRLRRFVLVALGVVALMISGWYGAARLLTVAAQDDLAGVQADVQRVRGQQRTFDEQVQVRKDTKTITDQLTVLFANDLSWARLNTSVRAAAPADVRIVSFAAQVGTGDASSGAAAEAGPAGPAAATAIGRIAIAGDAPDKEAVAAYLTALSKAWGVGNPVLVNASRREADDRYDFTLKADITSKALGGRYASAPAATPAGG